MHRLTQEQYLQAVFDIFGPDIEVDHRFAPEIRESGLLSVGSSHAAISPASLESFAAMARHIAAQVVDEKHRDILIGCKQGTLSAPDETCTRQFIADAGRLLYRRPLTSQELEAQLALAADGARMGGNAYTGLEASLASMLMSPEFLFRWERAEPDPELPKTQRLDSYSKAARLSFFLWNATPDDELLKAAEAGTLQTSRGWDREVDRMLASPRLQEGARAFFADMLGFDGFAGLSKDQTIYPKFSNLVAVDAQEQTLRTITDHLLVRGGDYRDLFTTRKTFLTRRLGTVYKVPVVSPEGWEAFEFPEGDPRGAGILSQASFLALHSHPGRSSPTLRGRALRELLLCQRVPNPPGNVKFNLVQDTANPLYRTARQRLHAHATEAMCTGCHKLTDPIGLALENFDTTGGYREAENGAVIDASGQLNGMTFTDAAGLGKAVHDDPAATSCLVSRLYSFAVGRVPTTAESDWLRSDVQSAFARNKYRILPLLKLIATSPAFVRVTQPEVLSASIVSAATGGIP